MILNNIVFNVTINLWYAVRALRYIHRHRTLWVDVICINQEDDKELGHQMSLMSKIYQMTLKVLTYG
jgi:hypothetical protein